MVMVWAVPALAYNAPAGNNTNELNNSISRENKTYHISDTIYYSVKVYLANDDGTTKPCYQKDINTYYTSPHDLVLPAASPQVHTIDFPVIPELLPGESVIFANGTTTCRIYDEVASGVLRSDLTKTSGASAMPAGAVYSTSTTNYPGGTAIGVSNYPALDYVIASADLVANPNLIAFGYSWNTGGNPPTTSGAWDNQFHNDSSAKEMSISTFVSMPDTQVTITANLLNLNAGQSTTLTVTEHNTGNVNLTSPHVVVLKNGATLINLTAPPTSGDGGIIGTLDVGETWTWNSVDSGAVTVNPTTFEAVGHGMDDSSPAVDITVNTGHPNEHAQVSVSVNQPHTTAHMSLSTGALPKDGGDVTITITDTNDGTVALHDAHMHFKITPLPSLLPAPSGSGGMSGYYFLGNPAQAPPNNVVDIGTFVGESGTANGIMDVGETWTWSVTVHLTNPAAFEALGHGIDPLGNSVNYPDIQTERAVGSVDFPPPVPATTDLGIGLLITGFAGAMALIGYRRLRRS